MEFDSGFPKAGQTYRSKLSSELFVTIMSIDKDIVTYYTNKKLLRWTEHVSIFLRWYEPVYMVEGFEV